MSRRGQGSVEYIMLLCVVMTMALIVGSVMAKYGHELTDMVGDKLLDAVFALAAPY